MRIVQLPSGGTLTVVSRQQWGGGLLRRGNPIPPTRFRGLVAHHTPLLPEAMGIEQRPASDVSEAIRFMKRLQTVRPDLGSEVPYSWVILRGATGRDAIVCEGLGRGITGAHTAGMNSKRYGVAFAQNLAKVPLTTGQAEAFRWLGRSELVLSPLLTALEATTQHKDWAHVSKRNATSCAALEQSTLELLQPPFKATRVADLAARQISEGTAPLGRSGRTDGAGELGRWIRLGDTGPDVRQYQLQLNLLLTLLDKVKGRVGGRLLVTGTFDEPTDRLTVQFQQWAKLADDSGIVGDETRRAVAAALDAASAASVRVEHNVKDNPDRVLDTIGEPWTL